MNNEPFEDSDVLVPLENGGVSMKKAKTWHEKT